MSALPNDQRVLSPDGYRRIDREIAKFPPDRKASAVIAALAIAQDEIGWVSQPAIEEIAAYLEMPPIAVYEVATFYGMYNKAPVGRFKIGICTNLPCALRDGARAGEYLKDRLGVGYGETTADGRFTLVETECLGACADAPVLLVDNKRMCSFMSRERLDALLDELNSKA